MASSKLNALLELEVPVIVTLGGRKMRLNEVMSLAPGAIIELTKHADDELELLVNNKQIGTGTAVKVGENFGIRVTFIGDLRERIRALGPSEGASEEPDQAMSADEAAEAAMLAMLANQGG